MRLSTPSALDHTLASWAERLRERLDLPLLVRWQGGSLRLGQFEQALVTVDVRDTYDTTFLGIIGITSRTVTGHGQARITRSVEGVEQ